MDCHSRAPETKRRLAFAGLALVLSALSVMAQTPPKSGQGKAPAGQDTLMGVEREIERSTLEQKRLGFEIDYLSKEAQALRTQLVEVARRVRRLNCASKTSGPVNQPCACRCSRGRR